MIRPARSPVTVADLRLKETALRRQNEQFAMSAVRLHYSLAILESRLGRSRVPVSVAQGFHEWHLAATHTVTASDARYLKTWVWHVERLARVLRVTIAWVVLPGARQAYAWSASKRIEVAPITSAESYITVMHELGHTAKPCVPSHRRVRVQASPRHDVCVDCELRAWAWAVKQAHPEWTLAMHKVLQRSLNSYRQYATRPQARAIDVRTSGLGFCRARLKRALEN